MQNLFPSLAQSPAQDVEPGAWGKAMHPSQWSQDLEARGGFMGPTKLCPSHTLRSHEVTAAAVVQEHSLFETPPAWENICPAHGDTQELWSGI